MVIANFEQGETSKKVRGIRQWDYGQVLRIQGLHLPTAVEIHFSLQESRGDCVTRIGVTRDGVTDVVIPDSMVENDGATGKEYYIYAWVYLTDETSGHTEYEIKLSVETRSKPEAFDRPEDAEIFREAIKAVNEAADRAEEAAKKEVTDGRIDEAVTEYLDEHGINPASTDQIDSRDGGMPITPLNLDYAMKRAMTDGFGESWTDKEKVGAWARLSLIKTKMDQVAVAGATYILGELRDLSIILPGSAMPGQEIIAIWYNGKVPSTLSVKGNVLNFDHTPVANTRSEISFMWDGQYWRVEGKSQDVPIKPMIYIRYITSQSGKVLAMLAQNLEKYTKYTISFKCKVEEGKFENKDTDTVYLRVRKDKVRGGSVLYESHTAYSETPEFDADGYTRRYTFTTDSSTDYGINFEFNKAMKMYLADFKVYKTADESKTNALPVDEKSRVLITNVDTTRTPGEFGWDADYPTLVKYNEEKTEMTFGNATDTFYTVRLGDYDDETVFVPLKK